jgi:AmmeMemoRadiSam system protein B
VDGKVRPAAVAGSFYSADAETLRAELRGCFTHPLGPGAVADASPCVAGVVPHAGYLYSGACAAHLYAALDRRASRVILLGVNHRGIGSPAALSPADFWETPLGRVEVDRGLGRRLLEAVAFVAEDERPHAREHSIEVQLPFLQTALERFAFLPLSLSHLALEDCEAAGGQKVALLASTDLSHYLRPDEAKRLDDMALERVLAIDPRGLYRVVRENDISMCGVIPTVVFLFAATLLGARGARLLKQYHSGDIAPMREVVGYASVAVDL